MVSAGTSAGGRQDLSNNYLISDLTSGSQLESSLNITHRHISHSGVLDLDVCM